MSAKLAFIVVKKADPATMPVAPKKKYDANDRDRPRKYRQIELINMDTIKIGRLPTVSDIRPTIGVAKKSRRDVIAVKRANIRGR
jgi:hypothetical protein|tara:strand:- start:232 stop:486 length:255 start_codon:yes stop_codon:yes gene_type:complete